MKQVIGLTAALLVGAATLSTAAMAQSANTTQMTGSNATGVKPEGSMNKMSGAGGPTKSKKMTSKKSRM
ncbi:hypothetical protein H0176_08495 [Methylorubrum populi]|jgi:hypothetical protein|uniref:Pentapeptide MXKDX repeat protein n=1 Tax=Methylorubrum rhodesianum TaxID=29427 RepID=A0ABU9Z792_9HYPH|nr:hypothetical protein [Methylorubrum rhodesianum]MBK3403464.1 hypothetical protein [Methylorubrum rhodesianum]MBY0140310.1 hypothetical protein [Methylorubrum populi]MRI56445.1 hypothetical protein [Methylobacterium sp. DB1607]